VKREASGMERDQFSQLTPSTLKMRVKAKTVELNNEVESNFRL
jgi:hypothetical protein